MPSDNFMEQLTALVLAGGLGKRLGPATDKCPKVLLGINGRPFLMYLLDKLVRSGIRRAVLCTGHQAHLVSSAIGGSFGNLHIVYSCEPEPLGTAGALRLALRKTRGDDILVLNGDSYFDADLRPFALRHKKAGSRLSMLLAHVRDVGRFGSIRTNAKDEVVQFSEKGPGTAPGWINAGIYLFQRPVLQSLPAGKNISLERDVLPANVGNRFHAFRCQGHFIDIGTPESFAEAEPFFQEIGLEHRERSGTHLQ
jgi:NDP-sugar pyrophosphorylase family protein